MHIGIDKKKFKKKKKKKALFFSYYLILFKGDKKIRTNKRVIFIKEVLKETP